ncbi:beta-carotene hydroxylase [Sporocytophaga myxococcoides]|uniref:Beta-carotene hydroxylase n=1 Tax=Sporocytophaga myxococcoides TaxID=153721 RepID=A0A098LMK7_9BACT|nr:sterol desaturase family protein [Sporocytophaga myxococcoides]GAL87273.1 beta-carotene hydroxylase [Sporocytophaga myxococcoides]
MYLNILIVIIAFASMEAVAWMAHKYIMHGFLWIFHKDHHRPGGYAIEHNDFFFLLFATPAIICFLIGFKELSIYFWIATGITLYGLTYFIIHDIFIHQRIKWLKKSNFTYLRAIRKAHKVHHKHLDKEDGECFGMLWVPIKYFKEAKQHAN